MKKNLFVIRTVGDSERIKLITSCFNGDNNYVVVEENFNNPACTQDIIEDNYVKLSSNFLKQNDLMKIKKTGWQCGDYVAYAAYQYFPDYDYYWVVDDDVHFNCDMNEFISQVNQSDKDLLALNFGAANKESWSWYGTLENIYPDRIYGMLYSLVRLSKSAVRFLMEQRSKYHPTLTTEFHENFANDETFTATYLMNNGFKCGSLKDICPQYFGQYFSFSNPIVVEELTASYLQNKIVHPVCNAERAYQKTIQRIKSKNLSSLKNRLFEIFNYCGVDVFIKYFKISPDEIFDNVIDLNEFSEKVNTLNLPFIHKIWFYKPDCLVLDFKVGDFSFGLDLNNKSELYLIARNENAKAFVSNFLEMPAKFKIEFTSNELLKVIATTITKTISEVFEYKLSLS